jgi:hypothetical protein
MKKSCSTTFIVSLNNIDFRSRTARKAFKKLKHSVGDVPGLRAEFNKIHRAMKKNKGHSTLKAVFGGDGTFGSEDTLCLERRRP